MLLFSTKIPSDTARVSRLVILPLNKILWLAIEEAEDFVVHIQTGSQRRKSLANVIAGLRVDLSMGEEVVIAVRTGHPVRHSAWSRALILICVNVAAVMRDPYRYKSTFGCV